MKCLETPDHILIWRLAHHLLRHQRSKVAPHVAVTRSIHYPASSEAVRRTFNTGDKKRLPRLRADSTVWTTHVESACACLHSQSCEDWAEALWA